MTITDTQKLVEPVNFSLAETIKQLWFGPSASKEADDCLMSRAADLLSAPDARLREAVERCAVIADNFEGSASLERCDDPCAAVGQAIATAIRATIPKEETDV